MPKFVTVEKDGQQGQVMPVQVEGLEKHGWTVVDDGSNESGPEAAPEDVAGDRPATEN